MSNKKGKSDKSGIREFSKAYTTRALKSAMVYNKKTKAAANRSEEKSEKLPTVRLTFRLTGRYQNIRRSSVKREEWPRNEEEMAEKFITLKQVEAL